MDFIPCVIKQLPEHKQIEAAEIAVKHNPLNGIARARMKPGILTPQQIAVYTDRWWKSGGVNLTVSFMGNVPANVQQRILSHMNAWNPRCKVLFTLIATGGQVRISLGPGGYYSYLGTDILSVPQNEQTMNLEAISMATSESEMRRVVRHETGHTLGCIHEHVRRELVARINPQKALAYFESTQGWSEQEVYDQVLTPVEEVSLMGTAHAEQTSIMCYDMPASITNDGLPIIGGVDITEGDFGFMSTIYPKAATPPPPPPPPPPSLSKSLSEATVQGWTDAAIANFVAANVHAGPHLVSQVMTVAKNYIDSQIVKNFNAAP